MSTNMQEEAEILLLQAREHYAHYNIEAGHACIDRAIALDPANEVYLLLERAKVRYEQVYDAEGAIEDLTRIIEQSQVIEEVAEARRLRNRTYRYEGQRKDALEDINWVIERTPTAVDYAERAETHGWVYNYDAFMADYGCANELDPTNCDYRSTRAEQYLYRDQFEEAINDLNEIIQWSDDKYEITGCRRSRARCLQGLGCTEEWLTDVSWIIEYGTPEAGDLEWRGRYRSKGLRRSTERLQCCNCT
jgi:tetratricopeptide (TPR) repeat protein